MKYSVPITLPSLLNLRVHWREMKGIKRQQRFAVKICMRDAVIPPGPLVVTITRVGPRKLDDDNLQGACKYVRDQIADIVGVDDGSPHYTWIYKQQTGRYGVEIEITSR